MDLGEKERKKKNHGAWKGCERLSVVWVCAVNEKKGSERLDF